MLEDAVRNLKQHIRFDTLLVAAGTRNAGGSVTISEILGRHHIDQTFIDEYPAIADEDVVGQLFAAYPRIVQTISVADYRNLGKIETGNAAGAKAGRLIAAYLEKYGIRHLMLAGLDSSYGLAWMTFYRKDVGNPFDQEDAEWAKYLVPATLFKWQHQTQKKQHTKSSTRLLPLTTREMQIAILNVQGMLPKTIADQLGLSTYYVQDVIKKIRCRLQIAGRKMTVEDLEKYGTTPR